MFKSSSLLAGLVAITGAVAQTPVSTTTLTASMFTSSVVCNTLLGSEPAFPPDSTSVSSGHTSISTGPTQTTYVTFVVVTAEPSSVTGTTYSTDTVIVTSSLKPNTFEVFEYQTSTVKNLVLTSTVCAGASPVTTVTAYTGSYQPSSSVTAYPTSVICTNEFTSLLTYWPYVYYPASTITYTPRSTVTTTTLPTTVTRYSYIAATAPDTTITVTGTSYVVASTRTTTTVNCAQTATTTLNAKCAPTNLIGAIDGTDGIFVEAGAPGSASVFGLASQGNDPSLCCQICLDTEGCAASSSYPAAGNCQLYFTNATSTSACGEAFSYGNNGKSGGAYAGSILQTGCGIVVEDPSL